ncbi:S8 family peptidase [Halocatena salina]|uniref:S8 family peptidase n=1 Tax=Halocatena salina TaxID=2934340 RepID=A0A8U0A5X2_9EURY|nr:S8 family peptidase [Halocatena salina]UPM43317.1 S8 family peptidase [Halocatena salina]
MREDHSVNRRRFLQLLGMSGLAGATGVSVATPSREPGPKTDELLVGVSATASSPRASVESHLPSQANVVHENDTLGYVAVELPDQANDQAYESLKQAVENRGAVKYVEPNTTHRAFYTPNDPQYGDQYADQMVNAPTAWEDTLGDSGVTIAVVDQGIKYDHPDLSGNMASDPGQDFVDGDGDPYPDNLSEEIHGTHVAGIAAAGVDNGTGVSGIGNSTIISGRALSEDGTGSTSDIADAVEWAADQGADVINLSLGGGGYNQTMKNAVSYATDNGALIVAAAGNSGSQGVSYPAAYSECVAISALDSDGSLASYSQYGTDIELAAPGTDVLSAWTDDGYNRISGTSMATPVVAGIAGLTLAKWDLTNSELRSHLKNTAVDVDLSSDKQGSGRADAGNAVTTEPGDGGGGGGGDDSITDSVTSSLSGYWDSECHSWNWEFSDPTQIVVELDGPSSADFDLFVNEGTGSCPSRSNYTHNAWSTNSQESITIENPDTSAALYMLVDSYSGSGEYTLTVTESA